MNLRAVVLWPLDVARDWTQRFVAIQGIDRAMALGAQAYTALIPLLIVYVSLLPRADNEDFADVMIKEFELTRLDGGELQARVRARRRGRVQRDRARRDPADRLVAVVHARDAAALRGRRSTWPSSAIRNTPRASAVAARRDALRGRAPGGAGPDPGRLDARRGDARGRARCCGCSRRTCCSGGG